MRVRDVRTGGSAAEAKPFLQDDDVSLELGGKATKTVEALTELLTDAKGHSETVPVLLTFDRAGERMLTVVSVGGSRAGRSGQRGNQGVAAGVDPGPVGGARRDARRERPVGFSRDEAAQRLCDLGLQVGDIILAVNGDPLTASQPSDADLLATTIRQIKIGTEVQLDVLRGHEARKVAVKLGPSPRLPREMKKYDDDTFEFRVRDVSPVDRERAGWPEAKACSSSR